MQVRRVAALAGVVLIAACAGQGYDVYHLGGHYGDVQRGAFRYAGADRDFETVVVGNPFDQPKSVTERAVIDAMRGRDKGMNTNFTTAPRNAHAPYRIVMAFNVDSAAGARMLCRDPGIATPLRRDSRLTLAAVFCAGDRLYFATGAAMPEVRSSDDSAFRRLVDRVMHHFVPFESMIDDEPDASDN